MVEMVKVNEKVNECINDKVNEMDKGNEIKDKLNNLWITIQQI
jgi:hypothetical protein